MLAGRCFQRKESMTPPPRNLVASMVLFCWLSVLPDIDVAAFRLGIAYSDPLGHRGATHSLLFALAIGVAAAWASTRWISAELFGIKPTDLVTMLAAALGIAAVAAISGYLPARRAVSIDPMLALRCE